MSIGPLRIIRQPRAFGAASDPLKEYWNKLARLAPAEVTGFYLTFRPMIVGALTPQQIPKDSLAPLWPWIGIALVIFVRWWATRGEKWWQPQWGAIAISTIAFLLWTITMGHYVAYLSEWAFFKDPRVSGALAAVFTFLAPYLYKGDPPPAPQPQPAPPKGPGANP